MFKNLENYLEEISHFLSGPNEREEILAEIRSHILEKAEQEAVPVTEEEMAKIIAAYGKPRQVAEKYLDGRPLIAPSFTRHLFRYATLLFAVHVIFIIFAVIFKKEFIVFPFLFIPRMGIIESVMYLPVAFLADFGIVALVLYFITRSGKDIKLPWPKFSLDLNEAKGTAVKSLAARITNVLVGGVLLVVVWALFRLFQAYGAIFLVRSGSGKFQPLLQPGPGRWLSLILIALLVSGALERFVKALTHSWHWRCWITAIADGFALLLIATALSVHHAGMFTTHVPAKLHNWLYKSLTWTLLITALIIAIDLVSNLVRLGRKRLEK